MKGVQAVRGRSAVRRASGNCGLLVAALALLGVGPMQEATEGATVVRGAVETIEAQLAAFNAGDVAALAANVAADFIWYAVDSDSMSMQLSGRDAFQMSMIRYFEAIPAARAEIDAPVQTGEFVAVRERAFWLGVDGQEFSQASLAVYQIRDGLIYRVWYYPVAE